MLAEVHNRPPTAQPLTIPLVAACAPSTAHPNPVPSRCDRVARAVVAAEDVSSQLYYWLSSSFLSQLRCEAEVKENIKTTVTSTVRAHREMLLRHDVWLVTHTTQQCHADVYDNSQQLQLRRMNLPLSFAV